MLKDKLSKKILVLCMLLTASASLSSCDGNNPFVPRADLSVTRIASQNTTKGVNITQTFKQAGQFNLPSYTFSDPIVTIENRPGLPRVLFKKLYVTYTIGNQTLPPQEFPISITIPRGGTFTGPIPILSQSDAVVNAVFPDGSFVSNPTGQAEVTLLGVDDNNNLIATQFTTPISFETDPAGFKEPATPANNQNNNENTNG